MSFKNFGFRKEILQAIDEKGYVEATPIQTEAIPHILKRRDILAGAQTGTGKTASFTLPLLQLLMSNQKNRAVRGLILTPTRELAAQVADSVRTYGKYLPLKAQAIFGGVSISMQIKKLRIGADILISTPGRLLDLISQKVIDLSHIEIFVIDEADRMMDMGFIHDIRRIITLLPIDRQNLLFSATFSAEIKKLTCSLLKSPHTIEPPPQNTSDELISQIIYLIDNKRKQELLSFLISSQNWEQVLVFVRTKHKANQLARQLNEEGIAADAIHGNKTQSARTKVLDDFKKGLLRVLVATDIAARGLDIVQLPHVVNFELPEVPEDYIHRIGRTGRAGNQGSACSLVCIDEYGLLRGIENLLKRKIPQVVEPGYEPDPSIAAEPIRRGRFNQAKNKNRNYPSKSHSKSHSPKQNKTSQGPQKPKEHFMSKRKRPQRYTVV